MKDANIPRSLRGGKVRAAKKQAGFTALEILGVLAVGLAIVAGAGVFIVQMFDKNAVKNVATEASNTMTDVRRFYSSRPNCAGLTNAVAINNRMIDDNMIAGANIVHSQGGNVTLQCVALNGVANQGISLTLANIESGSTCSEMVSTLDRTFDTLAVEGAVVKAFAAPLDLAALGAACSAGAVRTIVGVGQRL